MSSQLKAFKRDTGKWGLRNHVLILPLHSALSATARAIADGSDGAVAISHDWSGEIDNDLPRIIFTFSGYAANPNNFAVVFLTIGSDSENEIIAGAQALGLKNFTNLALPEIGSMEGLRVKAIEVANHTDFGGLGRPDRKINTRSTVLYGGMSPEVAVCRTAHSTPHRL